MGKQHGPREWARWKGACRLSFDSDSESDSDSEASRRRVAAGLLPVRGVRPESEPLVVGRWAVPNVTILCIAYPYHHHRKHVDDISISALSMYFIVPHRRARARQDSAHHTPRSHAQ